MPARATGPAEDQHVDFITGTIEYLTDKGYHRMGATPDAQDAWVTMNNGIGPFRAACDEVAADGYRGFALAR